ncbi:YcxB family protein [Flavobacterium sp.]|uniref:YcxB family protein n=1 Tax=Flavobacterium sp. TaxID=239 RepID=UPI00374DCFB7
MIQGSKSFIELFYFPDLIFILLPIVVLFSTFSITKTRLSNIKLKENIFIKFNNEYIEDVGESFNMKYYWKDIYKLVEKNDWFLIYIDKKCAKVIRKDDLKDNQYNELKELFNSLNIKKSLK